MELSTLIQKIAQKRQEVDCIEVTADSRKVTQGAVFVAVPGTTAHGNSFIAAALELGAEYIVCQDAVQAEQQSMVEAKNAKIIMCQDARKALWQLAVARYGTENLAERGVRVIGITGTNGKTTTAYVLEHLFTRLGFRVGVLGTVSYRWPGHEEAAPLTTPDSLTTHAMLAKMLMAKVNVVIMEVSSHALEQERVGGIDFSGAVFTNLTQDHLDFHVNMQEYYAAKAKLFTKCPLPQKAMSINADDANGLELLQQCPKALAFGLKAQANMPNFLQGHIISMSTEGLHMRMQWGEKTWELRSPLVGAFNAANLLAVQGIALGLGVAEEDLRHLENFYGVCGRLERVQNAKNFAAFVDYAHTPDALVNVLKALRGAGFEKIITVFGCGGNRDRSKRPLMGAAVAMDSDVAVLTSDNPRNEEPSAIIADVLPGLKERNGLEIIVEADRRKATKKALALLMAPAYTKAAVLIAGKGHEDYQIIQGVKYPYSDQLTIKEIAEEYTKTENSCA